jgi:Divergent InlB B-repeat domain
MPSPATLPIISATVGGRGHGSLSRRMVLAPFAVAAIWALGSQGSAQAVTDIPVLTRKTGEFQPARGPDHLAWEQNTRAHPRHYDVIARPEDGGGRIRVNPRGSSAAMGSIDGHLLVYQQFRRQRSDIKFYDLATGQRSNPPRAVNSRDWEYWPSLSEFWLLFARLDSESNRRLLLFNLATGERRTLDSTTSQKAFVTPGQVNGNYAVWTTCTSETRCNVYRHEIASDTTVLIPNPGKFQRAPSVSPTGIVYLSRGGRQCGQRVALIRYPLNGPETVLLQLPEVLDIRDTYAYTEPNGITHLYYERSGCGNPTASDIYKVMDPELVRLTVAKAGTGTGTVTSAPGGIQCGADCSEDYPAGTQTTLHAEPVIGSLFAGWSGACTGTSDCRITMESEKNVTATFELIGSITVVKDALPDDTTDFGFTTTGLSPSTFTLDDDADPELPNQQQYTGLLPGIYTITEDPDPDGWVLNDLSCVGGGGNTVTLGRTATIGLDPGEQVTCTFTNSRVL